MNKTINFEASAIVPVQIDTRRPYIDHVFRVRAVRNTIHILTGHTL